MAAKMKLNSISNCKHMQLDANTLTAAMPDIKEPGIQ